jgi:hypothetical protein
MEIIPWHVRIGDRYAQVDDTGHGWNAGIRPLLRGA